MRVENTADLPWYSPLGLRPAPGARFRAISESMRRNMSIERGPEPPLTLSVPEAGRKYFGLSRNGAYMAAARGEIPVIKVGRLLRVPIRAMERLLEAAG